MKLIVGLGNPGERYKNNRHNVGYMVVDVLQESGLPQGVFAEKMDVFKLAKTESFMNVSGEAVRRLINFYKVSPEDLYIVHDDLDIPLGKYKIQKGKGPKLHYGIQSIDEALGTRDYWRVRVGIENRKVSRVAQVPRVPRGERYVLQDFTPEEKPIITDVIRRIIADLNDRF